MADIEIKAAGELTAAERQAWRDLQGADRAYESPYFALEFFDAVARHAASTRVAVIRENGRVLLDFSAVEKFSFDPLLLGDAMKRLAGRGLRIAVASSTPEFFGVGRQVAQYSGVEGEAIAIFKDHRAAEEWLLSQPPRQMREEGQ